MTAASGADQPTLRDQLAEALGLRRNGPASDGRGWFRSEDERQECLADADALLKLFEVRESALRDMLSVAQSQIDVHKEAADEHQARVERAKAEAITDLCDDLDHGPLYAEATSYFSDRDLDADGLDVARIIRAAALRANTGGGTC